MKFNVGDWVRIHRKKGGDYSKTYGEVRPIPPDQYAYGSSNNMIRLLESCNYRARVVSADADHVNVHIPYFKRLAKYRTYHFILKEVSLEEDT